MAQKTTQLEFRFDLDAPGGDEVLQLLSPDDIYRRAEVLVRLLAEDRRIERKGIGVNPRDLGKCLSMWANTSPDGGVLVIGINDKTGEVEGCRDIDSRRLNDFEQIGIDTCPDALYDSRRVEIANPNGKNDFVLVFRVYYHPTKAVETTDRKLYVRRGDVCKELKTDDERRQLRIDKGEVQHEQEACGLKFPDDFNLDLIRQWTNNVRKVRGLSDLTSDLKILAALRLGKVTSGEFVPNLACAIMFASDPVAAIPGCKIHFLRFEGVEEKGGTQFNETANLPPIEGPLPNQIAKINEILETRIRRFSGFGKDGKFHTTPEYPQPALYEAIVNACVHRSYTFKNMKIFVRMFDDRLEIESPGPFPPGVTSETIYELQHSRNPYLMEAMRYMGFVKEIGEGAPRIRDTMRDLGLPAPEFSQEEVGQAKVRVVLRNNIAVRKTWVDSDVADLIGAAITSELSEREKIVLNYIAVHGSASINDAQRLTGHTWHTAKKLLTALEERGILLRRKRPDVAIDRQARYVVRAAAKQKK